MISILLDFCRPREMVMSGGGGGAYDTSCLGPALRRGEVGGRGSRSVYPDQVALPSPWLGLVQEGWDARGMGGHPDLFTYPFPLLLPPARSGLGGGDK